MPGGREPVARHEDAVPEAHREDRRSMGHELHGTASPGRQIGQELSNQFISTLALHPTDPKILYIGGPDGIRKTIDGGKTWQAQNQGLTTLNIRTISISASDPQLLYLGTNGSGLYRSTDGGQNWAPIPLTGPDHTPPKV